MACGIKCAYGPALELYCGRSWIIVESYADLTVRPLKGAVVARKDARKRKAPTAEDTSLGVAFRMVKAGSNEGYCLHCDSKVRYEAERKNCSSGIRDLGLPAVAADLIFRRLGERGLKFATHANRCPSDSMSPVATYILISFMLFAPSWTVISNQAVLL